MNKETRNFIWGLILLTICGTALSIHVAEIKAQNPRNIINNIMLILTIPGVIMGWRKIQNSL